MFAALAQLVERLLGKAEVGSSNLLGSLNHEAFRDIREAFFRVTGNFLLYEKVRTRPVMYTRTGRPDIPEQLFITIEKTPASFRW